ncbi:MAG: 2Fe-2S iron-sulfur cluster-binding protein [Pseudomonadota bacterium]
MRKYHPLEIESLRTETNDSVRISLAVPEALRAEFDFLPGQHVPVQATVDGKRLRRTYSLCSAPGAECLEIGVRVQDGGQFSGFAAQALKVGDTLDVMPPVGRFHVEQDAPAGRRCLAIAAGSGITPILSIVRATLERDADSSVVLFYGNRRQQSTMFIDDLCALKNRYPTRLVLQFLFSREDQEFELMGGRLDAEKLNELFDLYCDAAPPDVAYICGPDSLIPDVTDALIQRGVPAESIYAERFGAARGAGPKPPAAARQEAPSVDVTVIMDGHERTFAVPADAPNLVDAAADNGVELPYSCKGGVCATCRTHLRDGDVEMHVNYGLEPWELEQGYILACQARPTSRRVTLDYDRT